MESPSATLLRLMRRRVPPEKRQRTEMSCDWCKKKRCKCLRGGVTDSCRACNETGRRCVTTEPRKRRVYPSLTAGMKQGQSGGTTASIPRTIAETVPSDAPSRSTGLNAKALQKQPRLCHEYLFEDSMGFPRYIGPIGSYTLLVKLWEIMAMKRAPMTHRDNAQTMGQSMQLSDVRHEPGIVLPPRDVADTLVGLFFEKVHCDLPIFHRALFQATYERMWSYQPDHEPAWLMSLSMVFVLGLEAASHSSNPLLDDRTNTEELKEGYLSRTREVLPEVISGSMLSNVQALILYSRYLHITRNRNASWNITGAAIRVAVAIGLHRNGIHVRCSPLERELRKRIWWALYAFERMECSSLGRTSAIDDDECNVGVPTEGMLDMGDTIPLGYIDAHAQLMKILGSICKHQYGLEELAVDQLDFAVKTSERLDTWYSVLPLHLRLNSHSPESHSRAILLLHIQYHYTITLLCRPFLVSLVTQSSSGQSGVPAQTSYSRRCLSSAKAAVSVLEQLFAAGLFNSKTWWDVYFIEAISMPLAMGRFLDDKELKNDAGILESLKICIRILKECKEFSPTMQRFAVVTTDFAQALLSEPLRNRQGNEAPEKNTALKDVGSQPEGEEPLLNPVASNYVAVPQAVDVLHDPFVMQWNFPDLATFLPDWDGSEYWS